MKHPAPSEALNLKSEAWFALIVLPAHEEITFPINFPHFHQLSLASRKDIMVFFEGGELLFVLLKSESYQASNTKKRVTDDFIPLAFKRTKTTWGKILLKPKIVFEENSCVL